MDYPETDDELCLIKDVFNAIGGQTFGRRWDGNEARAHERPSPKKAKAVLLLLSNSINKCRENGHQVEIKPYREYAVADFEDGASNDPSSWDRDQELLNKVRYYINMTAQWPDPGTKEYVQEYERYARKRETHSQLEECLSSGKIHAWLDRRDGKPPAKIDRYHWNSRDAFWVNVGESTGGLKSEDLGLVKLYRPDVEKCINPPNIKPESLDGLEKFQRMSNLNWSEVTILFAADDRIEIKARGETARSSLSEIGLVNSNTGRPNKSQMILRDMTIPGHLKTIKKNCTSQQMLQLRKLLRKKLHTEHDPFSEEWRPNFKLEDVAKKRERGRVERNVSFVACDDKNEYPYVDENDQAGEWLKSEHELNE